MNFSLFKTPQFTVHTTASSLTITGKRESKVPYKEIIDTLTMPQYNHMTELSLCSIWIFIQDLAIQEQIFNAIPSSVRILNLKNCFISHIPDNLRQKFNPTGLKCLNSNLDILNLSANDLGYTCRLSSLATVLPVGLKSLILQGNHLGEVRSFQELHELVEGLAVLTNLNFLDLFQNNLNNLSKDSLVRLLNSMRNFKKLISLNLEGNHLQTLSGRDLAYIVRAIPKRVKSFNLVGKASYPLNIGVLNSKDAITALVSDLDVHQRAEYWAIQLIFRLRPFVKFLNESDRDFDKINHPNLTEEQILEIEKYLLNKQTRIEKLAYRYIQYLKNLLALAVIPCPNLRLEA